MTKGFTQIDYIIATGIFLVVFALVVQFVGYFFSGVAATSNVRMMTTEANDLLGIADKRPVPSDWPYFAPNGSVLLYMHLDNSTLDSGNYENNGISFGADCSATVQGKFDGACSFDGISSYVAAGNSPSLNFSSNSFSAALWTRSQLLSANEGIIRKGSASFNNGGIGWEIRSRGISNGYKIEVTRANGTDSAPALNAFVAPNVWVLLAITYDNSTGNLSVYANGSFVTSGIYTGTYQDTYDFEIGKGNDGTFNGTIDEVALWNRTLSADEIRQLYFYENNLRRIGLATASYRLNFVLNNSRSAWIDQSKAWANLTNELIVFNYSDMGVPARPSSTSIYDDSGTSVPYSMNGNIITFNSSVAVNATKNFTVYFDDDASFPERSVSVSGSNNLTENVYGPVAVDIVQYKKMIFLNNSNYTLVRNATQAPRDFRITLLDANTGGTILSYGPELPPAGNIVSVRRFVYYQNSTGGVKGGSLTIQTW